MGEFELIDRYFTRPSPRAVLGVGDDCALVQPQAGQHLAISTDMLVSGRHFFPDVDPRTLGHKALAVNLSDLAACGARPLAFTLALALPHADANWLAPFSEGLLALADLHDCNLIGGDTTKGPCTISITVMGEVPAGQALLRSGAQVGDDIYISGTVGDAALALDILRAQRPDAATRLSAGQLAFARARLEQPTPRVALGIALRGIASAAADISDGLLGDLGHILAKSRTGATLDACAVLNCMHSVATATPDPGESSSERKWNDYQSLLRHALAGGDDYELVFTAPAAKRAQVAQASTISHTPVNRIGHIEASPGLRLLAPDGMPVSLPFAAFDHFAPN